MATTYWDYTIKYGSTVKSTNTDTGLTSIVIKYGTDTKATITSATTKTCTTSGKYCNQNITIGAKTCAVSGKYCNQNISVTTSARYRWNKYNSVLSYSAASQDVVRLEGNNIVFGNPTITVDIKTYSSKTSVYGEATSKTFSTSTGKYTLSNGSSVTMGTNGALIAGHHGSYNKPFCGDPAEGSVSSYSAVYQITNAIPNKFVTCVLKGKPTSLHLEYYLLTKDVSNKITVTRHYSSSSYTKGSTSYGTVNSTSSTAYPTNGRHTDGYWYVAV